MPLAAIAQPTNLVTFDVTITAYSPRPQETDSTPYMTASGHPVDEDKIAANFLDFGTMVMFPELFGDQIFRVADRMAKKWNNSINDPHRVDIFMFETAAAKKFGIKRNVKMLILNQPAANQPELVSSTTQNQPAQKMPGKSESL